MIIFERIKELQEHLSEIRNENRTTGFVPTMGALHNGHLSLIDRSKSCTSYTVCSIFVNPVQFNNPEDLKKYPRTIEQDIFMLEKAGCDVLFYPEVKEMYPDDIIEHYDFGMLERVMEGEHRPGHFNGVAVVVKRLFDIVKPDKAFFGEKDYQQLLIIKELVRVKAMNIEIVPCPIVRESDGLAMSSRNMRLGAKERMAAPVIYSSLKDIGNFKKEMTLTEAKKQIISKINESGILNVEYLDVAKADNLEILENWPDETLHLVACVAVHAGNIRLIDNFQFYS